MTLGLLLLKHIASRPTPAFSSLPKLLLACTSNLASALQLFPASKFLMLVLLLLANGSMIMFRSSKTFTLSPLESIWGGCLGVDSVGKSFQDPFKKSVHRVHHVNSGNTLGAPALLRYNRRAMLVLSFVSQFASSPPIDANLSELDRWSVHRILKIPSNSMSRNLCRSVLFRIEVGPILNASNSFCVVHNFRRACSGEPDRKSFVITF